MWDAGRNCPQWDFPTTLQHMQEDEMTLVETDPRSRVVLPGHAKERFLMRENSDGSILLIPARVVSEAQLEYDQSPELQDLLRRAAASPTVSPSRHQPK